MPLNTWQTFPAQECELVERGRAGVGCSLPATAGSPSVGRMALTRLVAVELAVGVVFPFS